MEWLAALPAIACALLVLLGPGLLLAWFLRARGFALIAVAPLLSVSLVAVAAILAPYFMIPWSIVPVAVLAVLASAVAYLARILARRRWTEAESPRSFDRRFYIALLSLFFAAAILSYQLATAFGSPENISQTFDNIFHLNAIQYILETHKASSLTIGGMTGIPFYPAAWHAVVSLTVQLSAVSIPVAVSATNIAIGAVVWPLGCIWLSQQVLGKGPLVSLVAGTLSTGFGSFPLMMVDFGVLYPNLLSISLLPGMIAVGVQILGLSVDQDLPRPMLWFGILLAIPGFALAHPSTLLAFFAIMTTPVLFVYAKSWRRWRQDWGANRISAIVYSSTLLASFILLGAVWQAIRPAAASAFWPPIHSPLGSLWELLTNSLMNRPPAVLVSALIIAGFVYLVRQRRLWWVLGMFAVVCFLYLVVSSFRPGRIRDFVTAIWYNDSYRLAALVPSIAVLVATIGAVWIVRSIRQWLDRKGLWATRRMGAGRHWRPISSWPVVGIVATLVLLAFGLQLGNVQFAIASAHRNYVIGPDSQLLTLDEMAVLKDLDALVPPNAVIASNVWNGSALAYALADRKTLQLHVLVSNFTLNDKIVLDSLRDARTNPDVCPAVKALGVSYVLDFGYQEIHGGKHLAAGLDNLETSGVATLISQHGDARLFRFTGCQ